MAKQLSVKSNITLVCGRYGGVDQRFLNKNKLREVSIGDYVLSGGELAAAVMIDSICRKIPGVLGHVASASEDSFADGLLEAPYFTRPQEWQGMGVPQVLLSGDHKKVAEFRKMVSIVTTLQKRPDLLGDHLFSVGDKREINWSSAYNYFTQWTESQWQEVGLDANQVLNQIKERLTNG